MGNKSSQRGKISDLEEEFVWGNKVMLVDEEIMVTIET